jgi:hypothetical protein
MSIQKTKGKSQPIPVKKRSAQAAAARSSSVLSVDKPSISSIPSGSRVVGETVSAHLSEYVDRAFRIPIFLSTTNSLNSLQQQFLDRLIQEIEEALLFPRTLPESEQYPETILTSIRRLVMSSYGLLAINFRRFYAQFIKSNVGPAPTTTPFWEGSVYLQIEPSMAFQFGLPILLVRERGTDVGNGIWAGGITPLNIFVEWDSDNQSVEDFFSSVQWREVLANWAAEVRTNYYLRTEPTFGPIK